ncbi:hypothetical protein ACFVRD_24565 [Streptomyces sp. NPDC057908]|uniref:hypothetical protein n=2 Tax=Streptomyces TaxID=1883 RepID=UPI0036BD6500
MPVASTARSAMCSPAGTPAAETGTTAVRRTHPGVRATACQFEAVTSAVPFREQKVPVYGMYPFTVKRDMLKRMHGTDEHIGVETLRQGTETVYQLLAGLRTEA